MAHERTPEDFLAEIESQDLQQFLSDLRLHSHGNYSVRRSTCIPSLNSCLTSGDNALRPGDVIEIQGAPASGKTHVIYQLLMSCITPSDATHRGWGKAAIVYDTDGTFQVGRLKTLLHTHISRKNNTSGEETSAARTQEIVSDCLYRLSVFRPTSSIQLAASILNLGHLHATHPRFADQEIGLVVVDSLSSFYWQDRFTVEQFRTGPSSHNAKNPVSHVLTALETVRISHQPVVLLTNWGLQPVSNQYLKNGDSDSPFFKQHLHVLQRTSSPSSHNLSSRITSGDRSSTPHMSNGTRESVEQGHYPTTLPLTYHITLRRSSTSKPVTNSANVASRSGPQEPDALVHDHGNHGSAAVEGFVRALGDGQTRSFTFEIVDASDADIQYNDNPS